MNTPAIKTMRLTPKQNKPVLELLEEIREIRWNPERYQEKLMRLCGKHPAADGAVRIIRGWNTDGKPSSQHLRFQYSDGSTESFSQHDAARNYFGYPGMVRSEDYKMARCARRAIKDQIERFRSLNNVQYHEHVDHFYEDKAKTFRSLLKAWMESQNITAFSVKPKQYSAGISEYSFVDKSLRRSWWYYHKQNVVLRAIPAEDNIRGRKILPSFAFLLVD